MSQAPGQGRLAEPLARALLFVAFAALFVGVGLAFSSTRVFLFETDLFDADFRRVVHDLTRGYGSHYRTKVHPLFVLILNPLGRLLREAIGRPRPAAILMSGVASALAVVLFRELLIRLGIRRSVATLWCVVFGLSASQAFFGALPESFGFSGASLVLLFVAFASAQPGRASRLAAAVVAFGMTSTNLVAGMLLAFVRPPPGRRAVLRALAFGSAVIVIAALLSLVQKKMSPGTEVFFLPTSVAEEMSYLSTPRDAPSVLRRVSNLARSFLLSNLAAPELRVTQPEGPPPVARFGALRPVGWVHAAVWTALLLAGGMARWRRDLLRRPLVGALLLWIAFNLGLHFFYGDMLFLYSCHWTFAVLAVAAVAVEAGCPARARPAVPALLCLMAGLQAWANGALFIELHRLYR